MSNFTEFLEEIIKSTHPTCIICCKFYEECRCAQRCAAHSQLFCRACFAEHESAYGKREVVH